MSTTSKILNSNVNSTNTTYAGVSTFTFNVQSGVKYIFTGTLFLACSEGGGKVTIGGTANTSNFIAYALGHAKITTPGSNLYLQNVSGDFTCSFFGSVLVNTNGALRLEFAQGDTGGGISSLLAGSYMQLESVSY